MPDDEYDAGTTVTVQAEFRKNINGVRTLTTPTTTTLIYRKPDGTEVTVANGALTTVSTGVKSYDIPTAQSEDGDWWYQFSGVGNMQVVKEGMFRIKPSLVGN